MSVVHAQQLPHCLPAARSHRLRGRAASVVDILQLCSSAVRLELLLRVALGRACVQQLAAELDLASAYVSHQLRSLREAGLVDVARQGRWCLYQVAERCTVERTAAEFVVLIQCDSGDGLRIEMALTDHESANCDPAGSSSAL